MKVNVVFENVLENGEKRNLITSFENVKFEGDLPDCYLLQPYRFYSRRHSFDSRTLLCIRSPDYASDLSPGDIVYPEHKEMIIKTLKRGAASLKNINREIKEYLEENWVGRTDVIEV